MKPIIFYDMNAQYNIFAYATDKKGRILSTAVNSYKKTHPLQKHFATLAGMPYKIYMHAEIACLIAAGMNKVHTLHVYRYNKEGGYANAKPCKICQLAIKAFGVRRVFYTTAEGKTDVLETTS